MRLICSRGRCYCGRDRENFPHLLGLFLGEKGGVVLLWTVIVAGVCLEGGGSGKCSELIKGFKHRLMKVELGHVTWGVGGWEK